MNENTNVYYFQMGHYSMYVTLPMEHEIQYLICDSEILHN